MSCVLKGNTRKTFAETCGRRLGAISGLALGLTLGAGAAGAAGLGLDVDVGIGGGDGVDADVNVGIGGGNGINTGVDVAVGGGTIGTGVDVSVGGGGVSTGVGVTVGGGGTTVPGGGTTTPTGTTTPPPGIVHVNAPATGALIPPKGKLACASGGNATAFNGFVLRDKAGVAVGIVHDATISLDQKLVGISVQGGDKSCYQLKGGSFRVGNGEVWSNVSAASFR